LFTELILFIVSLGVLLAAARTFTVSAERIGLYLGMSPVSRPWWGR
jgi:hypothetical protein